MSFVSRVPFWLYLGTLLPFALCLFFYGTRSPWQRTPMGRALISLLASLVAILGFAVLVQITAIPQAALDTIRAVLLGAVALSGWVLLHNIRLEQKRPAESSARRSADL